MVNPALSSPPISDLILDNQLADVLEAHRSLVELHLEVLGERVDQIRGGHRLGDTILPAARFDQIVEEQRDDIVWLNEGAALVNDAKAVGVAVRGDADVGFRSDCMVSLQSCSR